ncbi:unnamed protein product [Acanthoscelides obtectus]|uniref:Uncharacterized protein n=1 Tax=Acanthoscelides obtectus TaxID=200917 RepID=A0A9P0KFX6_ACAOB|nr:unnamed protein product [Acanthoscelides obtectus]CAK1647598.1 hypothetical protein AOBTE_LOCUS15290 [Acanthoscelides obtectus]
MRNWCAVFKIVAEYPSGRIYEEAIQNIGQNYKQNQDKELNESNNIIWPHISSSWILS